jgi:hypothetical protein
MYLHEYSLSHHLFNIPLSANDISVVARLDSYLDSLIKLLQLPQAMHHLILHGSMKRPILGENAGLIFVRYI